MNLKQAQTECMKIDSQYIVMAKRNAVAWDSVYATGGELVNDLRKVYIPKSRTAPAGTFKGYEYIYSFAYFVQVKGYELSAKQMAQAKRLALEIKKAAAISDFVF